MKIRLTISLLLSELLKLNRLESDAIDQNLTTLRNTASTNLGVSEPIVQRQGKKLES